MGLVDDHPHKWPAPLQALEHRTFRWLWIATFVSNSGSWMQRVATAWLVYTLANSEAWLGFDAALAALPAVLLLPISGVLADRFDRRIVLIVANALNSLLALLLAVIWSTGNLAAWHLLASSFLASIVTSLSAPASQAQIPGAAGEDHIPNAIALNSFQYNVARAVGPAVGGLVLASLGAGWCFALNALSYLGLIAAVMALPPTRKATHGKVSAFDSLIDGIGFVRRNRNVQRTILFVILFAFGGAPMVTLLPVIAKELLNEGAVGYSLILAGFGIGAALAGIALSFFRPAQLGRWILVAAVVMAGCLVAIAWTSTLAIAVAVTLVSGFAFVGAMIELGTDLISQTPDELRGRISGLQQLCFRVAQPSGAIVGAFLIQYAGIHFALCGFGILLVFVIPVVLLFYRQPDLNRR